MKILIVKPSSLGDVVQAVPVLRLLKQHHPESRIYWWVAEEFAALLAGDPDLEGVFPFIRRGWLRAGRWRTWFNTLLTIRRTRFDLVLDLQALARSSVMSWLAGGGHLAGIELRREGAHLLHDLSVPRPVERPHAVDWYLDVIRRLGVDCERPFVWLPERPEHRPDRESVDLPADASLVALVPGARWLNKRWPVEHFARLAGQLLREAPRRRVLVLGGTGDGPLAAAIAKEHPAGVVDLTGRTTLPGLVEWLRRCDLVVTNDTGPMHIAAALGRPVISLFGPTRPAETGPYRQEHRALRLEIPCSPCLRPVCHATVRRQCLLDLAPETVLPRALALLPDSR